MAIGKPCQGQPGAGSPQTQSSDCTEFLNPILVVSPQCGPMWATTRAPQAHGTPLVLHRSMCERAWIVQRVVGSHCSSQKKRPRGNRLAGPGKPAAGPDVTTTGTSSSDTQSRTQVPGVIGPRDDPKTAGLGPGSAPGRLESGSDPGPVRRPSATGGTGCPYQIYQRPRAQVALRSW